MNGMTVHGTNTSIQDCEMHMKIDLMVFDVIYIFTMHHGVKEDWRQGGEVHDPFSFYTHVKRKKRFEEKKKKNPESIY